MILFIKKLITITKNKAFNKILCFIYKLKILKILFSKIQNYIFKLILKKSIIILIMLIIYIILNKGFIFLFIQNENY